MSDNKYIVIIRGLSGSGKTTLAQLICGALEFDDEKRVAVSADDFFIDDKGNYVFEYEKLSEAHDWCKAEVESCAKEGFNVIVVHNNFTKRWEVSPYIEIAQKNGYRVHVVNLYDNGLNDSQLAERCCHNIPINSISSQRERWELDAFRGTRSFKSRPQQHFGFDNSQEFNKNRAYNNFGNRDFQHRNRFNNGSR
jgi:hypothetical protein